MGEEREGGVKDDTEVRPEGGVGMSGAIRQGVNKLSTGGSVDVTATTEESKC